MNRLLYTFFLAALSIGCLGQDMIYYTKNKIDKWRMTEINPQYIKAVDVSDPEMSYSTTLTNVLFVFNKKGDFLVIPKLYQDATGAEKKIKAFFQPNNLFHSFDKIITHKNEIIVCTYEDLADGKITYKVGDKSSSIAVSNIALIVFRSGDHKLFVSADKAYKTLSIIEQTYTDLALSQQQSQQNLPQKDSGVAKVEKVEKANDSTQATVKSDVASGTVTAVSNNSSTGAVKELEPSTVARLQNKALVNIKQLGDYMQIICQKDAEADELNKTIEQALSLFVAEARIEVSSITRSTVNQFKVKDYLVRMSLLKYEKVLIEWYNVQYTSQLRKGPDGLYYGTIEFEQRFVGITTENMKYEDITRKSVEVVLRPYERLAGGQNTVEWDVFLGDIGVTATKSAS
jgi:hypothetical protein